ncbi:MULTISPECIES: segregation/condensation protein A [unclassified Streptococcus]|uniref:segregation/condensation protein A n=1 Tax=unclassified Streptococcus TaxID=2608887 RepID=UPI0010724574|nr:MULTISPECIES: segregation/condensation protein A [unclassified Streptococcus]MBF0787493.1 segregation/condensation protein A [Streptococcus sp. 19428wC2_LYSM12]MCQ9212053.1 segregation/condensation protein A [Streptococcus sp. B01]MCQ9213382.1 segregation/condensation protein A [Streptococcus sp. O1]TFV05575.1 segregation/condensation protein A [Streptococcus sp. LYSM12]
MDIKLKDFEGPLDLLLHLVSKYQMDIYEVPITEVIEQYLAYIATLQAMRLEVAGEYMVMASQLMLIKSRRLLPKVVEQEDILDDPEQELLSQLEEYRTFKALSEKLKEQHDERAHYFSKPKLELVYDDVTLNQDKSVIDIFLAFSKVMAEKQEELRMSHTTIARDEYKIEDMMAQVRSQFQPGKRLVLRELFAQSHDMNEVITIFLATLEMVKSKEITMEQPENFGDIYLIRSEDEPIS